MERFKHANDAPGRAKGAISTFLACLDQTVFGLLSMTDKESLAASLSSLVPTLHGRVGFAIVGLGRAGKHAAAQTLN